MILAQSVSCVGQQGFKSESAMESCQPLHPHRNREVWAAYHTIYYTEVFKQTNCCCKNIKKKSKKKKRVLCLGLEKQLREVVELKGTTTGKTFKSITKDHWPKLVSRT